MEPIKHVAPARPADVLKTIEIIITVVLTLLTLFLGYGLWLFFNGSGV